MEEAAEIDIYWKVKYKVLTSLPPEILVLILSVDRISVILWLCSLGKSLTLFKP